MVVDKTKGTVEDASTFFSQLLKDTHKDIIPVKTNKENTAILADKTDKQLYTWAKDG